jgi:hypothetical protein
MISSLVLSIGEVKGIYRFPERTLVARFVGVDERPDVVKLSGELLPMKSSSDLNGLQRGWSYDTVARILTVRIRDLMKKRIIVVE